MQHLDDDDLILLALDEIPENQRAASHLDECAHCRDAVQSWRVTVGTARESDAELGPEPAPAHVWDAIAAEIGLIRQEVSTPLDQQAGVSTPLDQQAVPLDQQAGVSTPLDQQAAPLDQRREQRRREQRRWAMPLMAAAIGALISGLVVYFAVRDDGIPDNPEVKPQLEAIATLEPLDGATGELGKAELVKSANGVSWLQVQVGGLPAITGSYEVWLLGADGKMVSLGVLAAGQGNFALPQGIDPASYSVVDISNEPADGNPAHSKNSVARGELA